MTRHRPLARVLDDVHQEDIRMLTGESSIGQLPIQSFHVVSPVRKMRKMYGSGRVSLLGGVGRIPKDVRNDLNDEMPVRFGQSPEGE